MPNRSNNPDTAWREIPPINLPALALLSSMTLTKKYARRCFFVGPFNDIGSLLRVFGEVLLVCYLS